MPMCRISPARGITVSGVVNRQKILLLLFLVSGAAALVYEVTWTRAISVVLGSTTYALSTMLATFMLGLAMGAWLGGKVSDRKESPIRILALTELGIGLTGLISVPIIYSLPGFYLTVYRFAHNSPILFFVFQILLCAIVMLVPTILMGATFPMVTRCITETVNEIGRKVAAAYSYNTIGAVLGSLGAGFVLIPELGLRGAAMTAASLNLAIGIILLLFRRERIGMTPAILVAGYVLAGTWTVQVQAGSTMLNFYSISPDTPHVSYDRLLDSERSFFQPLCYREYPEGSVRAYRTPDGYLLIQVGGKIEGTGPKDLANTHLLSYLPLASHDSPRSMLVVGLGAGSTLEAARPHIDQPELVEIHPGVVECVRIFGAPGLLDNLPIHIGDARNFLLKTDRRYDIITSEPSYPTEFGVTHLYTREYYELAAARLNDGGIYCQWIPYYLFSNRDVTIALKTFTSVFKHAMLWKLSESMDLIVVGSQSPFTMTPREVQNRVARMNAGKINLNFVLSRTPEDLSNLSERRDIPMHTDDRPVLEFSIVNNILKGDLGEIDREEIKNRNLYQ